MIPIHDTIPARNPPLGVYALIGLNVLAFAFELSIPREALEGLFYLFGIVPARYTHPDWARWAGLPVDDFWPFLTSMFLHGGWAHIIGNMWALWIFGDNVEDRMGPVRFVLFYLICGLVAGVVQWVTHPHSVIPTVGASGAIAGVLGAYFVMFPQSRVVILVPILFLPLFFEVPAVLYLMFWALSQVYIGTLALAGPGDVGGVAWWAHVGGFAAGMLLHGLFVRPRRMIRRFQPDEYGTEGVWT
ncbi:MAG TPA: rhomboid family intramembrane serine protease [Isosphaeraceae bacterium]|jgi:membrane associated rhomboid family serine protease|nr:rhomboid family intramembrane serine protease [Isosphaeraceae bacterium]